MNDPDHTPPPTTPLHIDLEYSDRVNLAMQQNGVPLVEQISLTNRGDAAIVGIELTASLENGECDDWSGRIDRLDPGSTYRIVPAAMRLSAARLAARTEAQRTTLRIKVTAGPAVVSHCAPIDILAFDQWPGIGHYPELLAAFATPNHPRIAELLTAARTSLGQLSGNDALDGYQAQSRQRALLIAESCFNAALAPRIGYIIPPASFDTPGQRIRVVDRILREKLGSCLDLSILLASLWEQAGLHPLILLLEGHAIPAVWTHESHLPEPSIDEAARIRNLIELGEIIPVESTLLTQPGATFSLAVDSAKRKLTTPGSAFCAVDIRSARKRGVRPLPLRAEGESSQIDLDASDLTAAGTATTLDPVALADRAERSPSTPTASKPDDIPGQDRIRRWQTRLLDLSLRNRLINFRETGTTLRFALPDVSRLEDMLAAEARFSIHPRTDGDDAFRRQELEASNLFSDQPPAETQARLLKLYRTAKAGIEETGANLLHIAIGMLKWFETDASETPRYAPLILLPVQLTRTSTGAGYRYDLALSQEPLRPNVTLLEKLRTEFGMNTAGLEDFPEDDRGIDVPMVLRNVRATIKDTRRWEVEESAFLGLFSFNKFLMWRDLRENMTRLRENRLVGHLVNPAAGDFDPTPFPRPEDLDDQVKPQDLFCTRDADSTQLAAVRAAATGRTFVLEGPPGTGKSQTIANIIADSLARGKRVLFVAEKMAALSVVRDRLEKDGLGPFCLELHSAKASKKEVLAQLSASMQLTATAEPPQWSQWCSELGLTRDRLNTYIREMHRPRSTGESFYQVLGRIGALGDGPRTPPPAGDITSVSADQLTAWRTHIATIAEASTPIDPPHTHPLRGIALTTFRFGLADEARASIAASLSAHESLKSQASAFITALHGNDAPAADLSRASLHALVAIAELLPGSPSPDPRLLTTPDLASLLQDLRAAIALGRTRDARRTDLLTRYREEFLTLDHLVKLDSLTRAMSRPGPLAMIAVYFNRRHYRPYCNAAVPPAETLRADLQSARQLTQDSAALAAAAEAASLFGRRWKEGNANWDELESLLAWCERFTQLTGALRNDPAAAPLAQSAAAPLAQSAAALPADHQRSTAALPHAAALVNAWNTWTTAWNATTRLLAANEDDSLGSAQLPSSLAITSRTLSSWLAAAGDLDDWCAWRLARDNAASAGLTALIDAYERGELTRNNLLHAFERGFGESWFTTLANTVEPIRGFNAGAHHTLIARFRDLDRQFIAHTRYTIAARLAAKMPSAAAPVSAQSEMGILRREMEKKRRHLPTRRLIESMPNLLPRLKPCFLMSPLSVAQYLDANLPPFDLVVFDEASQIPVWDAIGAIARGAEVIIVGDSKQLPPTTFFSTIDGESEESTEEIAVDDMESILKECNASGIPPMRLSWHYRSRHESLITFSNHHYYENRLHTFPSPQERSLTLGVTFRHIARGIYDRGGSGTNRIEAQAVIDEVVTLLTASENPASIGIVTFSQAQQQLIEDLLDARRRELPAIDRFFTAEVHEPVFIKNLENVQGDERDTILFSVGYGPDQAGKTYMNFGPLNSDGGERRLNVAVTRARERLIVFSSLRSDQIDLKRTRALGVRHFKTFLDYADRGPRAIAEAVEHTGAQAFDSGFETTVCNALTARGLEIDTQVGCGGYRIDLAVRDPARPGRYLLGIECDGAAYHSARTARDRDRLRQTILEGLGWRLHRIWSTEWKNNPDRCIAAVLRALEDAKQHIPTPHNANPPPAPPPPPAAEPRPAPPPTPALPEYRPAIPTDPRRLRRLDIYDPSSQTACEHALAAIVRAEGPIVEDLAFRRMVEWFGIDRMTDRCRARLADIRDATLRARTVTQHDETLWPPGTDPAQLTTVRTPGQDEDSRRVLEDIPPAERSSAVLHILTHQFGLPREELARETAKLLGTPRVTSRVQELLTIAIDSVIASGQAVERDHRVSLADKRSLTD